VKTGAAEDAAVRVLQSNRRDGDQSIIRSTCYQNQDKKQQLVWALKGVFL